MKTTTALCLAAMMVCAPPARAQEDLMGDLNLSAGGSTSRVERTPSRVLDDIGATLDALYADMGNGYVKETDPKGDGAEDTRWQERFEDANGSLKSLWQEFLAAVKGDRESRQMGRDEAFRAAAAGGWTAYRQAFGALQGDPTRVYDALATKAEQKRFRLVREQKWLDPPTLSPGKGVSGSGWGDPTRWSQGDLDYAAGLLPAELLSDVNMGIRVAFRLGYLQNKQRLQLGDPAFAALGGLDWNRVGWDTTFEDDFYYGRLYGASFLPTTGLQLFPASEPRSASIAALMASMQTCAGPAEEALARAEGFKAGRQALTTGKNGEMVLAKTVPDEIANPVREEYSRICDDFKAAMDDYKRYLDEFRRNYPGEATSALQTSLRSAFQTYRSDFLYGEVDQLAVRFEKLRGQAGRFTLKRKGMFSFNKTIYAPSSWGKPRRELYSAQRVLALLPADLRSEVDRRRQEAFRQGALLARAEYDRLQAQTVQPASTGL